MRKILLTAAVAVSAIAAAAPAAAQYAPYPGQPYPGQYAPYGNAYGYNNNYGQVRRLEVRVDQVRRTIQQLDRRNILSNREARQLSGEARWLDQRINVLARNGFNQRDSREIEVRLARLEQRIRRDANDRNIRGNYAYGNGYSDRDRDGRNDRYEDDRGWNHD